MKRVSVIIPVYNSEKTIDAVLNSIANQTAVDEILEVIVIDDGSVDHSSIVIKAFINSHPSLNVRYIKQDNGGVSTARNHGLREAKGEFIALFDSDDLWLPQKIEKQLNVIDNNPEIVFLGTAHFIGIESKKMPLKLLTGEVKHLYNASLKDLYWKHFPATSSILFRRKVIESIGYFDESQSYCEDINYFQKFCINYNYYFLPEFLVHLDYSKPYFGSEGLSSNFKGMHLGSLKNLKELKNGGYFNLLEYLFYRVYFELKYWRRILKRKLNDINYR